MAAVGYCTGYVKEGSGYCDRPGCFFSGGMKGLQNDDVENSRRANNDEVEEHDPGARCCNNPTSCRVHLVARSDALQAVVEQFHDEHISEPQVLFEHCIM